MKLDKIGFSWSGEISQKRWFQRLDEFKELQRKNKLDTIRAHMPLHSWIYQQKKNFHRMPADRKRILLKVGVVKDRLLKVNHNVYTNTHRKRNPE